MEAEAKINLEPLKPSTFFSKKQGLLKQKDVLEYEAELKKVVSKLLDMGDRKDASTNLGLKVVSHLTDPVLAKLGSKLDVVPTLDAFTMNLIHLLADLHVQSQLVRQT